MPWKFGISWGLVNIPCKIHHVAKEETISFHMISPSGSRVRQKLIDEVTGEEVKRNETKKGYETAKGQYVIFDQEEIKALRLKSTKTIDIIGFTSAQPKMQPDFALIQKENYYISPEKGGEKGYSILYEVLKELNIMAVGRVVLSSGGKESIVTISVQRNMLLLTVLYYPCEIQQPPQVELVQVSDKEKELGKQLIQALGKPDFNELKDRYINAVKELIKAKMEGREIKPIEIQETTESDIAAALEKSLGIAGVKKKKLGVAVAVDGSAEMVEV
jgi:DNA end-binding protein Ku